MKRIEKGLIHQNNICFHLEYWFTTIHHVGLVWLILQATKKKCFPTINQLPTKQLASHLTFGLCITGLVLVAAFLIVCPVFPALLFLLLLVLSWTFLESWCHEPGENRELSESLMCTHISITRMYVCVYICMYTYIHMCIYTSTHMYIYIYIYTKIHIDIYIYTYICMHTCIYIYIHT